MIEKITLHCVPPTSEEEPSVVIQGHTLHDMFKVDKFIDDSTRFSVKTAAMPLSLTTTCFVRQRLINDILPEFKRRVSF